MRPETMVPGSDAETSEVVVEDGEETCSPLERSKHGANEAHGGRDGEDGETEPVDLLVPILPGNRRKGLLRLQGMGDIVVWDVEVDGNVVGLGGSRDLLGRCGRGGHGGRPWKRRGRRGQHSDPEK